MNSHGFPKYSNEIAPKRRMTRIGNDSFTTGKA